jgi:hypothetical protein
MSLSPNSSASSNTNKRRRMSVNTMHSVDSRSEVHSPEDPSPMHYQQQPAAPAPTAHIPKRGARACTNCRKGKNRCEGEVSKPSVVAVARVPAHGPRSRPGPAQAPCRRCQLSGLACIFEKPEKKNATQMSGPSVECVLLVGYGGSWLFTFIVVQTSIAARESIFCMAFTTYSIPGTYVSSDRPCKAK